MSLTTKIIGGVGFVLTLSFLSASGQTTDSSAIDSNFLFLQLESIELEGVEVISKSQKESVELFNPIANNSTSNMDEVLERIPQVQLVKRGSFAYDPQINSLSGGQITVSIDGMRIFGACTDKMDPSTSYIEPINLKKADVSCHSNSSLEGSNVGGSLNLSTRKASFSDAFKWGGELNSTLNSNSLGRNFSGGINLSGKKIALKANGAYRKHDNYRAGGGEEVKYTQYEKQNFAFNLRTRLGSKWIFDGDYLYDKALNVGYAALPMDVSVARTNLGSVAFTGYNVLKGIEKIKIKAYANQIYHEMDDSKRPDEEVAMRMDMPGWSNTYGAFSSFKLQSVGKHNVELKADYYYNFRRAEMIMYDPDGGPDMFMLTWPDVVRNSLGIAGVDKINVNDKNNLIISGRLDWSTTGIEDDFGKRQLTGFGYTGDEVYVHFPYSVSTTWNRVIGNKYQFRWSAASSSRLPTTSEMYGYFLFNKEDGYDYIGKPDIKTEKSVRTSMELIQKGKKLEWSTVIGYNRLIDYVYGVLDEGSSAMTIGGNGVKYFENLPWAQIVNFSLQAQYDPFQKWNISTRFNYNWAEKMDKSPLPQIQPFTNITGLRYKMKKLYMLLESEMGGSQELIDPEYGEDTTPSWAVLNFKAGYQFNISKTNTVDLKVGIENIFDQYYYRHLDWGNIPRKGRNIYLNLAWRF